MTWPTRSRHFLRLGKTRYAPLLLFVQPHHFNSTSFDQVLSILFEKIQQELTLDPKTGAQIVISPQIHRPCHVSENNLHFCYYWVQTYSDGTILVPQANQNDVLTEGCKRDLLISAQKTLVVCVFSCPIPPTTDPKEIDLTYETENQAQEALMDMTGLARPAHISHYFAKKNSSDIATVDTPRAPTAEEKAAADADTISELLSSQSNSKKRKR